MFYILCVEQYWLYYGKEYCDHMADYKKMYGYFSVMELGPFRINQPFEGNKVVNVLINRFIVQKYDHINMPITINIFLHHYYIQIFKIRNNKYVMLPTIAEQKLLSFLRRFPNHHKEIHHLDLGCV